MADMKHITVTPADDDEVIIAGLQGDAVPQADAKETKPAAAHEPASEEPDGREETARAQAPREEAAEPKPAKTKPAARDAYHETTLEDLERTPMPLAQRIVIIAAVVCIIGALVYYFTVMR